MAMCWLTCQMGVGANSKAGAEWLSHKEHIYIEYHSVCPLVGIGTPPLPLPQTRVPASEPKGGTHSPAGEGVGAFQFRRLEKKLSTLSTLWIKPSDTLIL